ncbi:hypothetical protein O0L34_g18129 [Tuta absoluta]|nr:hypothetical protein O0L34_g18129 [Tuta absoluta]
MLGQGMVLSYPASLMPALTAADAEIKTDLATASWIASSIGVAGIPGFFLSSFLMDRLGRRIAQILVIIPGILGWIITYLANTATALLIGRILCGISAGASVGLGAVIIGEYTSPGNRGMFLNLKTAVVCVGGMFIHIFGHFYNWRTVALISLAPCVLGLLIALTWPESPAWLASNEEFAKSEKAFYWLRGKDGRSEKEIKDLIRVQMERAKTTVNISIKDKVGDILKKFTQRDFLKPMFIICLGSILLEAAGRHIFPAFALDIIGEITGSKRQSFALTLAIDLIIITSATFSSGLMKLMKRRLLLFTTGIASIVFLAAGCLYLFLVSRNIIPIEFLSDS